MALDFFKRFYAPELLVTQEKLRLAEKERDFHIDRYNEKTEEFRRLSDRKEYIEYACRVREDELTQKLIAQAGFGVVAPKTQETPALAGSDTSKLSDAEQEILWDRATELAVNKKGGDAMPTQAEIKDLYDAMLDNPEHYLTN